MCCKPCYLIRLLQFSCIQQSHLTVGSCCSLQLVMGMLCFTIPGLTFPMCFASRFRLIVRDICTLNNLCEDSASAMSGVSEPTASVSEGCYTRDLANCTINNVLTPTPSVGQSAAKLQSVLQYLFEQTTLILQQLFCIEMINGQFKSSSNH